MSQPREDVLRRAMGLGPAPDPAGLHFEDGRVRRVPEAKRAMAFEAWHREGARARLAADVAHLPQRLGRGGRRVRGCVERLRAARALAWARTLVYRSRHLHPVGETRDIEGYFDLGRSWYPLSVLSAGILAEAAEHDWAEGRVMRSDENVWSGAECVLVPASTLDDRLVAEAIGRWYRERFRWQRGHWSQVEGRLPAIRVDLAWSPPERL